MRAAVLFLAFVAAAAMPAPVAAQSSEQTIYASVVGKKDRKPIEGLSVTDFVVKEDGKCYRETLSPVRGSVDKREQVPCDTKCNASG